MALNPGSRIGPFEVLSSLGVGGMGEVYRARDSKLHRDVALKVLPAAVATHPDRLARFAREARVLASLNHPNIAQIHGFEDAPGSQALVMELVDGSTLADRLARGALPVDETVAIASQIAEALEAAHAQGIVHRDLKPANIKVRPDGTVKVLDFGLAKVFSSDGESAEADRALDSRLAAQPTVTSADATLQGMVLGTPAYMSPEQAAGSVVDKRTDLWALGCVVYEMLTGRRAFTSPSDAAPRARGTERAPDWSALPAETPAPIRRLLRRCLEPDAKRRLDSASAARLELDDARHAPAEPADRPGGSLRSGAWQVTRGMAAAVIALAAGTLAAWVFTRSAETSVPPVTRFTIALSPDEPLALSVEGPDVAISPAGSQVAYTVGAQAQLMVRPFDRLDATPIAGVTGARAPFFSPDGNWIAFFTQAGELRKVPAGGGPSLAICKVSGRSRGASWGPDGNIVFATVNSAGLLIVSAAGGEPTRLTTAQESGGEHFHPSHLPDGGVLFSIGPAPRQLAALDRGGRLTTILQRGSQPKYLPSGHLVFAIQEALGHTLWAVRFDPASLQARGEPVVVDEGPLRGAGPGSTNFALSPGGALVYVRPASEAPRELIWLDRQGSERSLGLPGGAYGSPRVSPDGNRAAVLIGQFADIWTFDLIERSHPSPPTQLTFDEGVEGYPVWSGNASIIFTIFTAGRPGFPNVYRRNADGSGSPETLLTGPPGRRPTSVSRDLQNLVFEQNNVETAWDVLYLRLGDKEPVTLIQGAFDERNAVISPDGKWVAYDSTTASGQTEVYVSPFPNAQDEQFLVSMGGGRTPVWSPSDAKLFYTNGPSLMSVAVRLAPAFSRGAPQKLFDAPSVVFDARQLLNGSAVRNYDVTSDGQRFLAVKRASSDPPASMSIVVVQNWMEEVKARVPGR